MKMSNYIIENVKTKESEYINHSSRILQLIIVIVFFGMIMIGLRSKGIMILTAALIAIYLFFLPSERNFEILLFGISFINIFKLSYTSSSLFTYMPIIPIIKVVFIERSYSIKRNSIISIIAFALYVLTFIFTGITPLLKILIGFFVLICLFQSETLNRINCKSLIMFYSYGIITSAIFALLFPELVKPFVSSLVVRLDDQSALNRFSGLYENSNYFSMEVSFALASHMVLFFHQEEKWNELLLIGTPLVILGIMSQSKAFVLTLVIMLFLLYYYILKRNLKVAIILLGIIFVVYLFLRDQLNSLVGRYFYRIISMERTDTSLSEITTGRSDIWKMYIERIIANPDIMLLGNGLETIYGGRATHNMFIEMIFCMGIMGCTLYMIILMNITDKSNVYRNCSPYIIIFLFRAFSANIAFYNNIYYYYLIFLALRYTNRLGSRESLQHTTIKKNEYGRYIRT